MHERGLFLRPTEGAHSEARQRARGRRGRPVAEIIEEWRSHSSRGRYKDDIWRPEILNDLVGSGSGASTGSGVPSVGSGEGDREEQVDAFEAGGLFRMFGRMANQDAVRARAFPPASGLPTPR